MERRNWIDIVPGKQSLRIRVIEESNSPSSSFTKSTSTRRRSGSFLENEGKSSESIPSVQSLVWRSMESMFGSRQRSKKKIPVLHCNSGVIVYFRPFQGHSGTQSYWSFIEGQCCDSERILPKIFTLLDVRSIFILSSTLNWYLEVRIRARDRQYSSCPLILETKVTRILKRLTWMYRVMHHTRTTQGRDIKTQFFGSTSTLLLRKD